MEKANAAGELKGPGSEAQDKSTSEDSFRTLEAVERNEADGFFHSRFPTKHHKNEQRSRKPISGYLPQQPISGLGNYRCLPVIILIEAGYFGKGLSGGILKTP